MDGAGCGAEWLREIVENACHDPFRLSRLWEEAESHERTGGPEDAV
jgi:hypothetical protein